MNYWYIVAIIILVFSIVAFPYCVFVVTQLVTYGILLAKHRFDRRFHNSIKREKESP